MRLNRKYISKSSGLAKRSLGVSGALSAALVLATACSQGPDVDEQVASQQAGVEESSALQPASTPTRYIVKFNDASAGKSKLAGAGIAVALDLSQRHNAVAAVMTPQQAAGLAHNPNVVLVEKDPVRVPLFADAFPEDWPISQGIPYGIDMVQANHTDVAQTGPATNVSVCIIDSGYLAAHEDLRESGGGIVVNGYSGVDNTAAEDWNKDGDGHGSHVAGTIAGADNGVGVVGVLPLGVNLTIVRVFGDDGIWGYNPYPTNDPLYGSELAHAMGKCQDLQQPNTKLVVSMSLGGGGASEIEEAAFKTAYDAGNTIVVAAAGNDGTTGLSYPASYTSVVSVGAVDADANHADFSQRNVQVEVSAPGVGVMSTISHSGPGSVASSALSAVLEANAVAGTPDTTGASGDVVDGGNCASPPTGKARKDWRDKVLLCGRDGETYFQTMVDTAGTAGASAVVIHNHNLSGGGALSVSATGDVPGVGVNYLDGQALLGIVGESATVTATTISPDPQAYTAYGGTSMATPHVSGVAALLWQNNLTITSQQLRTALRDAAISPLGANAIDDSFGHGIIKAAAAHTYLKSGCAITDCSDQDPCTWNRCAMVGETPTCLPAVDACVVEGPPAIDSMDPSSGAPGQSFTVDILGHDFRLPANITIDGTGVTLTENFWYNTTELSSTFTIAANAQPGPRTVTFAELDSSDDPIASATSTFTVLACTGLKGDSCTTGSECCSGTCVGKPGSKTCK